MLNTNKHGVIFNIQKFSVHDGPGIRTVVFLKGCPLRCKWCSNPESQPFGATLLFDKSKCTRCGLCVTACKNLPNCADDAISLSNPHLIHREKATGCEPCASVCPTKALTLVGENVSVDEVMAEVSKDAVHYRRSQGGMTLSGGEPLSQPEFAQALLRAASAKGIHTAMETTAYASPEVIEQVIPLLDVVLLDIKSIFTEQHKKYTGVNCELILKNALRIAEIAKEVHVRIPLIPGFNADDKSIQAIASFATHMRGVKKLHILPYHNFGKNKYDLLGIDYEFDGVETPPEADINRYKSIVESYGLECAIGG